MRNRYHWFFSIVIVGYEPPFTSKCSRSLKGGFVWRRSLLYLVHCRVDPAAAARIVRG